MGGGHYDWDAAEENRSTQREVFTYQGYAGTDTATEGSRACHVDLNVKGHKRECRDNPQHPLSTPIVVAMDVTRSRGDDAKLVYHKLPSFIGQIVLKGYVPDPEISFAAIGDASAGDLAPIQVGQFESDNRLDEALSKIWLEEGGGGTGQESYELMAYYFAKHSILDSNSRGKKGYFFFVGDEGFYPRVSKQQIKDWIGDDLPEDVSSAQAFTQLQDKYHVFFIYPQKSWQDRKGDIDAEIKKRVEAAGGLYEGVDIRASLLWNNRNDLDLHVITPAGFHLYYGDKRAPCGGWLDVDMNVRGETTKPVENIRWKRGEAPKGHYQFYVLNYAFHESDRGATPFRVEIEINGQIKHFEGQTRSNATGGDSQVIVYEFDYNPNERPTPQDQQEAYAAYDDTIIKEQWASVIPRENILIIDDPNAIVDVMMGALALVEGTSDLDSYLVDMQGRSVDAAHQGQMLRALGGLASTTTAIAKVETTKLPVNSTATKQRGSKSKRL